jgi:tryptophanyl-tRNA synthetase
MTIGNDQIWITDIDKKNGFISFYQIGDQVFGNVDEEAAERIKERIAELRHELAEYESQLNVVKELKKGN